MEQINLLQIYALICLKTKAKMELLVSMIVLKTQKNLNLIKLRKLKKLDQEAKEIRKSLDDGIAMVDPTRIRRMVLTSGDNLVAYLLLNLTHIALTNRNKAHIVILRYYLLHPNMRVKFRKKYIEL